MQNNQEEISALEEHCAICFDTLIDSLNGSKKKRPWQKNLVDHKCPLFVTWYMGKDEDLRGCIGTFAQDEKLSKNLSDYALTSAFKDSRFNPIKMPEVENLTSSVNLQFDFVDRTDIWDWEVGKLILFGLTKITRNSWN